MTEPGRHLSRAASRQCRARPRLLLVAVALGSCHLALDLGLLSLPSRSIATEPRLEAGGQPPHALERFMRAPKRVLAAPHGLTTRTARLDESPLALVRDPLALVRDPLPLIGDPLPLVRDPLPLIGDTISFVCATLSLSKLVAQPLDALGVHRHCFSIAFSDASNLQTSAVRGLRLRDDRNHPRLATWAGRMNHSGSMTSTAPKPGSGPSTKNISTVMSGSTCAWERKATTLRPVSLSMVSL
jgi:hypothetical protein